MSKLNSELRIYVDKNEINSSVMIASAIHCRKRTMMSGESVLDAVNHEVNDAVDTLKDVTAFTDRWETVPYTICDVFIYANDRIPTEILDVIANKLRTVRLIHEVRFYFRKVGEVL